MRHKAAAIHCNHRLPRNKLHHRRPQTGRTTTKHSQVHLLNINKKGDTRKQKRDKTDTMANKKGDKKGVKRKQKGDKTDTMTNKNGDKKGNIIPA